MQGLEIDILSSQLSEKLVSSARLNDFNNHHAIIKVIGENIIQNNDWITKYLNVAKMGCPNKVKDCMNSRAAGLLTLHDVLTNQCIKPLEKKMMETSLEGEKLNRLEQHSLESCSLALNKMLNIKWR